MVLIPERVRQDEPLFPVSQECDLHLRIRAEFAEMPGLKLTLPQAARLFNLEKERCERVLGRLVEAGALAVVGRTFVSAGAIRQRT
jgi:hypothetical protein